MSPIIRALSPYFPKNENIELLIEFAEQAEQVVASLALSVSLALTVADLAKEWIGLEKIEFTAAAGLTVGTSKAIREGFGVIRPIVKSITNGVPGDLLMLLAVAEDRKLLPQGLLTTAAVFYATMLLGIIIGSGAQIGLNEADWDETIVATTMTIGGLATAAYKML